MTKQRQSQPMVVQTTSDGKGPAQPAPGSPPPNLGHNGNGATNSNGNIRLSGLSGGRPLVQDSQGVSDGKGPAQPAPGTPPPNLGHNGNGATNSRGNLRR